MNAEIDGELRDILEAIAKESKNIEEWSLIESDDYFQEENYVGGFDATEKAFCFSYYHPNGQEYWFQLTLEEIDDILLGKIQEISMREANL